MKTQDLDYDIIIIGGGPAGLSFAALTSGLGLRIAVIDPAEEKALKNPAYDGREIALTHHSHQILTELGAISAMPADAVSLIKKAHVLNGASPYALKFDHQEAGTDTLGFMASNQNIRKSLFATVKARKDITLLCKSRVSDVEASAESAQVTLDSGKILKARLIVAADGRMSATRRKMGIQTQMNDLGRTCLVGIMKHDGPHHDTAYECFHYDRTLAVLPLNNGLVSVVITLPSTEAEEVMNMDAAAFSADITQRFEGRVGTMSLEGKMHSYPLLMTYASRFTAPRFALLGDAAVGMHPVTAHGFNLGLRGAHALAGEIKRMQETGGDIAAQSALHSFARGHHLACRPLYHGTNALVKLYTSTSKPARFVRKSLLHLGNALKPANALITKQLTDKKAG